MPCENTFFRIRFDRITHLQTHHKHTASNVHWAMARLPDASSPPPCWVGRKPAANNYSTSHRCGPSSFSSAANSTASSSLSNSQRPCHFHDYASIICAA
jgi:hypothetical protein